VCRNNGALQILGGIDGSQSKMTTADWALAISIFSASISLMGFAWNVWSKFIFPKAKVHVSFGAINVHYLSDETIGPFLSLSATNYGPGQVTLHAVVARSRRDWRKRFKRQIGLLNPLNNFPNETNSSIGPFGGGLPKKVDVGEEFSAFLTFQHEALRDEPLVDVGFADTFGRFHWAPRKSVRSTRTQIRETFPKPRSGPRR
jgi:hypothetical protein